MHRSALVGIESPLLMEWTDVNFPLFVGNAKFRPLFQQKQHLASKFMFVSATSKHNDFIVMD